MLTKLSNSFDAMERQRTALQDAARALNDAQLNWTPGTDVWSTLQIIEHLVLSDETVGRAHEPGSVKNEAPMFRVLPCAVRRALILRALRRDFFLPLPSLDIEPHGDVPLPELLSRWEAARNEMRQVLNSMQSDERRYSHPVLGPLTAAQMLKLGQTHTAYHTRQIETLQSNTMFPKKAGM